MRSVTLQDSGGLSFYIASYKLLATYTFHATAIAIWLIEGLHSMALCMAYCICTSRMQDIVGAST